MPAPKGERNPGEVVLRAPRGAMREWCPHCGRKGLLCLGALGAKRRDRAGYTWAIAASASSSATRTWRRSGRPDRTASGTSHLTTETALTALASSEVVEIRSDAWCGVAV